MARVLVHVGLDYHIAADGLVPPALRDLQHAVESGRFAVTTPFLAVATMTGCLLAYLQVRLRCPHRIGDDTADELTERILRMLGVNPRAAHEIAHRPMPAILETTRSQ